MVGCGSADADVLARNDGDVALAIRRGDLSLSALFDQGDGPSLYIADSKTGAVTLERVAVKAYERDDVLISGGVAEGANVVALGVQKLNPAGKVRVVSSLSF